MAATQYAPPTSERRLKMQYAGGLVKHLGLSMYRGAVPAIAELLSNAWDADATKVAITIPFGTGLKDQQIQVLDDGCGMTWDEVDKAYLVVGRDRRKTQGEKTPGNRVVMGRKGLGKLAGFGIARIVEVRTVRNRWLTHFAMDFEQMTRSGQAEMVENYEPTIIEDHETGEKNGTSILLKDLLISRPIEETDFRRSMSRHLYLVPNSIVVSRGCPHVCDFCYKEAFFEGGKSFYTQTVEAALAEIERLPGRHLYFLDDHLFGNERFARELFEGMKGMGRLWQGAGTVASVLRPRLLERAVESGLRSLFVGFETLDPRSLAAQNKRQNLRRDYGEAVRRLHRLGVMVNGSFVFGMDEDDASVFDRTVEWAVSEGIETATFHILTPYPGTALFARMEREERLLHRNWDLYDTRHVVFRTRGMSAGALEAGYFRAYRDFYRWGSIFRGSMTKRDWSGRLRHAAYAVGWKKLEPMWDFVIRTRQVVRMLPFLEHILEGFGRHSSDEASARSRALLADRASA